MKTERSSVLKMFSDVTENRKILSFPSPYSAKYTPYSQIDFSDETKSVCEDNKLVLTSLKICKVIILGDVCVGKTCIVNRFCHQIFESNYKATIGVDFEVEKFEILQVPFTIQIWDTAGQERFKSIAQSYYRSSHVIITVFDLSNINSLLNCKTWAREGLEALSVEPFIFLIGSKKDLLSPESYKIVESCATKVATGMKAEYWPVSSKTGENINCLFARIAALMFDQCILKENEKCFSQVNIGASNLISFRNSREQKCKNKQKCDC